MLEELANELGLCDKIYFMDSVVGEKRWRLLSDVDLADALSLLSQKPEIREQMGAAARERARRQFSPLVIAAHFREKIATCEVKARARI